jgi:hypothetical protein
VHIVCFRQCGHLTSGPFLFDHFAAADPCILPARWKYLAGRYVANPPQRGFIRMTPVWRLRPIDPAKRHWRVSIQKGELIIRAESENRAQDIAGGANFRSAAMTAGYPRKARRSGVCSPWRSIPPRGIGRTLMTTGRSSRRHETFRDDPGYYPRRLRIPLAAEWRSAQNKARSAPGLPTQTQRSLGTLCVSINSLVHAAVPRDTQLSTARLSELSIRAFTYIATCDSNPKSCLFGIGDHGPALRVCSLV